MKANLLFAFLLFATQMYGTACDYRNSCFEVETCSDQNGSVEANVGYFRPFSSSLRKVISGSVNYELLLGVKWTPHFDIVIAGDFFYKKGRSTGTGSNFSLWILPVTVGIRASMDLWTSCDYSSVVKGRLLLGPRWYFVQEKNSVNYLNHQNNAQGAGGVGGVELAYLYKQFFINAFANASFGEVRAHNTKNHVKTPNTQVGGAVIGGGLGWNF